MGKQMNSIQVIENSLFWQRHVLRNTEDQKQKERALRAITKLEAELIEAHHELIEKE